MRFKWFLAAGTLAIVVAVVLVAAVPASTFPDEWSFQCVRDERIIRLEYTPDGSTLIGLGDHQGGRLLAWRADDGTPLPEIAAGLEPDAFAIDPKGQWIALVKSKEVIFWNLATNKELRRIAFKQRVADVALSGNGMRMLVTLGDSFGTIREIVIWDIAKDRTLDVGDIIGDGLDAAISADGDAVAWSQNFGMPNWKTSCLDVSTGEVKVGPSKSGSFQRVWGFAAATRNVLVEFGSPRIWNTNDNSVSDPFDPQSFEQTIIREAVVSRSGTMVGVGGSQIVELTNRYFAKAVVFRMGESTPLGVVYEGDRIGLTSRQAIDTLALSPDGKHLATASSSGRIRSWTIAR
ncbi:MAG: WD40 repeat domain-containing protein [Planctomycetaceae bacterium]|nr:WD40 repeat domain-containing protein [Planctomycetaceae bacterium]